VENEFSQPPADPGLVATPAPGINPETAEPVPPPPVPPPEIPVAQAPALRDRGTGLMIFGVVQIIMGLLAALMVPFVALSAFLTRMVPGASMRPGQYISGIASYAFIAAGLLTLGIGSVRMKRWARALTLVVSWYWLVTGVLITVLMTAALPVMMRGILQAQPNTAGQSQAISEGVMAVILTIIIVFAAFFLIVVPIGFVVFYGRNDVAETCRRRDPVERWTDRVPLPILGASVVLALQSLYMLTVGMTTPLFPFFGRYLTGLPGFAGFFVLALLDGFLAVAFLRLSSAGWWISIAAAPVRLLSMALTYARADLMQAYSKIGFTDQQIQMLNSNPMFRGHIILWWSLLSAMLFFGYLIWIKRYFRPVSPPEQPGSLPVELSPD